MRASWVAPVVRVSRIVRFLSLAICRANFRALCRCSGFVVEKMRNNPLLSKL